MKQLTIMQYIDHFNLEITRQGGLWRINKGLPLFYVSKVEKIGRSYILTVNN